MTSINEETIRNHIKNDFDKCLFIKAGAGAGKSTILVDRILNQILAGEKPGSIVAITFTNKSAEDLKKKLLERLNKELVACQSNDSDKAKIIESAINNFNQMQVSTIHAFCNVLLSEQMLSSKLRKDVEMLQDNDLDDYLYTFFQDNFSKVSARKLDNFYSNYGRNTSAIFNGFKAIAEIDDSIEIMYAKNLLTKTKKDYQDEIDEFIDKAKSTIVSTYNRATNFEEEITSIYQLIRDGKGVFVIKKDLITNGEDFIKAIFDCCKNGKFSKGNGKTYDYINEALTAAVDDLLDKYGHIKNIYDQIKDYQHGLIMDVAVELRNLYRQSKDSKYISNDQLLQRAYVLIKDNKSAWEYYNEKYSRIYVDEFQDTDHVQAQLLLALCADSFGSDKLKAGKLVVVGDAKQSIYRFRGADLDEYYGFEEIMAAQPETSEILTLKYNFRSSPKIINWVNKAFSSRSYDGITPIENYDAMDAKNNRALNEGVVKPENVLEGVYSIDVDLEFEKNYIKSAKGEIKPNEKAVSYLVNLINKYVDNYYIFDRGNYRKVRYSDFLVLTRTASKIGMYSNGLIEAAIPVNVSGKVDISKEYALNTFARVYNYLAHNGSDKNANRTMELEGYSKVISIEDSGAINRLDIIGDLTEKVKNLDGVSLAYYLLNHLEYVLDKGRVIEKNSAASTYARLNQMVEKVTEGNENNKVVLADKFFEYLEKNIEREMSLESEQNAVTLMNVHKSKGLQGKIVIICDRRNDKENKSSHIHRENKQVQIYSVFDQSGFSKFCPYNSFENIYAEAKQAELLEYIRLEYVAATRAEEALIVFPRLANPVNSKTKDPQYNSFMSRYSYDYAQSLNIEDFKEGIINTEEVEPTSITVTEDKNFDSEMLWSDVTPSSKEIHDSSERVYSHDRPMGNVFGTIMHRMFELIITNKESISNGDNSLITYCINKAIVESLAELKEVFKDYQAEANRIRDYLKRIANDFINGEIFKEALISKEAICEYPFFYVNEDKQWVHGFSDLVLVFEKDIKIVDFKSDSIAIDESISQFEERLKTSYSPQLQLYKEALSTCFKVEQDKIKTVLYHLYNDHILNIE